MALLDRSAFLGAGPVQKKTTEKTNNHQNRNLHIEQRSVALLKPFRRNARLHSAKQIHQIATAIKEFGFNSPILVDGGNTIICGHGRVAAAQMLGYATVPAICIDHLTEEQKRAYVIADNKIALNAGWDPEILKIEFQELSEQLDINFDLEITGFSTAEIDILIDGPDDQSRTDPADHCPPPEPQAITRSGDIWHLGPHRVMCADARDWAAYNELMSEEKARLVFTDPPYNVPIDRHVCGKGRIKHREFAMASGEMTSSQFTRFLQDALGNAVRASTNGAIHFVCIDWRHMEELLVAGKCVYHQLKSLCVWNKTNAGMGSFYRSQHELIFVFKSGSGPHINTVELGKNGRYRTNVWSYAAVNTLRPGRLEDLEMHPTVKPTALVMDALKDASHRNDLVLDPFGGSGTTLIAAEKCRRRARIIEIDPVYVDVIIRRWQRLTKASATHALTSRTFHEVEMDSISSQRGQLR
jgi:DNA modification methylase